MVQATGSSPNFKSTINSRAFRASPPVAWPPTPTVHTAWIGRVQGPPATRQRPRVARSRQIHSRCRYLAVTNSSLQTRKVPESIWFSAELTGLVPQLAGQGQKQGLVPGARVTSVGGLAGTRDRAPDLAPAHPRWRAHWCQRVEMPLGYKQLMNPLWHGTHSLRPNISKSNDQGTNNQEVHHVINTISYFIKL